MFPSPSVTAAFREASWRHQALSSSTLSWNLVQVQGHLKTCGEVSSVRLKAFHFPCRKATGAQKLSWKKKKKKHTHGWRYWDIGRKFVCLEESWQYPDLWLSEFIRRSCFWNIKAVAWGYAGNRFLVEAHEYQEKNNFNCSRWLNWLMFSIRFQV